MHPPTIRLPTSRPAADVGYRAQPDRQLNGRSPETQLPYLCLELVGFSWDGSVHGDVRSKGRWHVYVVDCQSISHMAPVPDPVRLTERRELAAAETPEGCSTTRAQRDENSTAPALLHLVSIDKSCTWQSPVRGISIPSRFRHSSCIRSGVRDESERQVLIALRSANCTAAGGRRH